jgi:hypothetical protein
MFEEIHSSKSPVDSGVADHALLAFASRHVAQLLGYGEVPNGTGRLCSIPPDRIQRWLHELLAHRAAQQPAEAGIAVHTPEFFAPRTAESAAEDLALLEAASHHIDRVRVWYSQPHEGTQGAPGPEQVRGWLQELIDYRQHTLRPPQKVYDAPEAMPSMESSIDWESASEEVPSPMRGPQARG